MIHKPFQSLIIWKGFLYSIIANGPYGNLWFAEEANKIGQLIY